jgi:hypothetical protein
MRGARRSLRSGRHPGASRDPFLFPARTKPAYFCFARLSGERVTFLPGKVTKAKRPTRRFRQHPVAETSLRFSRQAGRRELAHPCAQTCAPCSRLALRCSASRKGAKRALFRCRPSVASLEARSIHLLRRCARAGSAQTGPLEHGERTTDQSEGWGTGSAPVRRRHRDVPSANPGGCSRVLSTRMCSGRVRGGGLSLGHLSLATQRKKVARPPGRRARKRQGCRHATGRIKGV